MSDANFLGTLSITGKCGTAELTKLVQDYKELEALREVEKAAKNICELLDTVGVGHIESQHDIDGLSDAWYQMLTLFKNLDKARKNEN